LPRALVQDVRLVVEFPGREVDYEHLELTGRHLDRALVNDRVDVVDLPLLRRRAVAEAQRDGGVARPLAADAQGARLGELLEGRLVLDGRYAETDLAVEEDAAVAELTVRPLLPARPDLAERDPQAAVHDGRS